MAKKREDKSPGGYDPGAETEARFNIEPLRLRPKAEIGLVSGGSGPGGPSMRKGGAKKGSKNFNLPRETRSTPKGDRVKAEPKKTGRQEAVTAVSLRNKPLPEAIDIAKSERHLIPKKEGGFVGAPYSAQTRKDLDLIRQKFDADVAAGASGADWYPRAQEWIKTMAGPDPARQSELARNLALFSAQADPGGNLGFSVKARNNAIMGMTPVSSEGKEGVVRTGQQWQTYKDAFDAQPTYNPMMGHNGGPPLDPVSIRLGPKTGIYAGHMDPTVSSPTTGTNDIWHARALGYTTKEGLPWESALSPQQHSVMDAETVLAVDRANTAGIGGRTDWTPGEIQAAPWVAGKGRGLEKSRNMTPEQGLAEASKTYPDSGGRDVLYDAQGAYVGPTNKSVGIFDEPGGNRVIGPAQAATPLVAYSGPTGRREVDPASKQMMTGTEGFRAMMDAQDAGAWSAQIGGQRMGHMNAYEVPLASGQQDREALSLLMSKAQGAGQPGVIHQGPQALVTDFADPGLTTRGVKDVQAAIPGAQPVRREGDLIEYGNEWAKGEGSDAVTSKMLGLLNPAQEAALSRPEVRQQVLAKMDRDALVASATGQPVRQDLQQARQIFADGGIPALKAAIGQGLLPVAVLGALLPMLADQEDKKL